MAEKDVGVLVIDSGCSSTKVGYAGDDSPISSFPTMIGISKPEAIIGEWPKPFYVGHEAISKRGILNLTKADEVKMTWDDKEKIWYLPLPTPHLDSFSPWQEHAPVFSCFSQASSRHHDSSSTFL